LIFTIAHLPLPFRSRTAVLCTMVSAWVLASGFFFVASAGGADTTCMLQNPSVSSVIQRADRPTKADRARRSINELTRSNSRQGMSLLETGSSVESEAESSNVNFHNPRVWGPAAWFFFHTVALSQADEIDPAQQERLRRFFAEDMPHLLPCPVCGHHAEQHVLDMNVDNSTFASRDSVAHFVWDLHDSVNVEKLGRNETVSRLSYERSVVNYAQTYDKGVTLLHFNNSDAETVAVSQQEHHKVQLLMNQVPTPQPSVFASLIRFVTSFMAQAPAYESTLGGV